MTSVWAESPTVRIHPDTRSGGTMKKTVVFLLFMWYGWKCPPTPDDILRSYPRPQWYFTSKIKKRAHIKKRIVWCCPNIYKSSLFISVCGGSESHYELLFSLFTRWCIRRRWWQLVHWPSTRRGQRPLTSPCPSWRRASASWCLAAMGPSLPLPSSVNLFFLSSSAINFPPFSSLFLRLSPKWWRKQNKGRCLHVGKIPHIKWNILFRQYMLAKFHLYPDFIWASAPWAH